MSQGERELLKSEQKFNSLFFHSSNAVFVLDQFSKIKEVNPFASFVTGVHYNELLNMNFADLFSPKDYRRLEQNIEKALSGNVSTLEVTLRNQQYNDQQLNLSIVPVLLEKVEEIIVIADCSNVNANKIAMEDELTGLPNRRFLMMKLAKAVIQANELNEKLAVMFIDLDRFKLVNDTLGHLLGDRALTLVATRLKMALAEKDLLARVGGDEFIVLISNLQSLKQAKDTADQLLEKIRDPILIDGYEFTLTASIGIAIFPESGTEVETLIKSADAAMYRAKSNGSDARELFKREMRYHFYEKFHVENDLRRALDRGEFSLYFQPQFNVKTNDYCGEEVLVRWFHPTEGLVSPSKFLSIAEETGLIVAIGEWVLREACLQKMKLLDLGYPQVPMSVNLSLRQFLQQNIVDTVQKVLEVSKLPPHLLEIEVTESVTIDIDRTIDVLNRLL
ncbi:diguanylate cyclase domain-containing protein, partial [Halalkalibacter akibai]|uniref:diguanylate cyclase domain-containing protein n=1 Tax=Halalkalibacter akibai TaxID=1411 RepID=UPI000557D709